MAREITDLKGHPIDTYDSDTNESLATLRVVEITDDCSGLEEKDRALLIFTKAKRGRIVQMVSPYPGQETGSGIHFFVDELEKEMTADPKNDTFGSWASRWGLTKEGLRELIVQEAPPVV